jgi:chemotaxis protein MotA
VVGSFGIILYRSTLTEFFLMFRVVGKMFRHKIDKPEDLIDQLVELAGIARKDGMIALQNAEIDNRLLSKGINALVDGTDPMIIRCRSRGICTSRPNVMKVPEAHLSLQGMYPQQWG